MSTVLVTGANRGIGLELCRIYQHRGEDVIAVCRKSSVKLAELGVRIIDGIDVSDGASVDALKTAIGDQKIDILINNAGVLRGDRFGDIDYEQMVEHFRINSLGPLRVTEALRNNLHEGSKVGIVSSRVGSIEDNGSGGNWAYRTSKTAVNMIGANLMHELKPRGVAVALLHPGLVATEMTGHKGIEPAEAARGLVARLDELTLDKTGRFWHAEGYELPW